MLKFIKKYGGILYIFAITVALIVILGRNNQFNILWATIGQLDRRYLLLATLSTPLYMLLRVIALRYFLRKRGYEISWRSAACVSCSGLFYSAITPCASGGQPMQIVMLKKAGVPVSVGTSVISTKFIGFQLSLLVGGSVLWLSKFNMVSQQLYGFRWVVIIGMILNIGTMIICVLSVPCHKVLIRFARWLINLGARFKVVKQPEERIEKARQTIEEYRSVLIELIRNPKELIVMLLFAAAQVAAMLSTGVLLIKAFGDGMMGVMDAFTLHTLLFLSASFIPLPGASGASEGGFCLFMKGAYDAENLVPAMVLWRYISYYLQVIICVVFMAIGLKKKSASE